MRSLAAVLTVILCTGWAAVCGAGEAWTVRLASPAAYDGDTLFVIVPELPQALNRLSIRVLGVDTPEIAGKCESERRRAIAARDFVLELFAGADTVTVEIAGWDKYGGRVDARVFTPAGEDLAEVLIRRGLGRPYDGGRRHGWCG